MLSKNEFSTTLKNSLIKHSYETTYTDKASNHSYENFYPDALVYLLDKPENEINILEIGVSTGGSLHSWMDVLPDANYYGIDHNIQNVFPFIRNKHNLHLYQCSQTDPIIKTIFPGVIFDLVIDDASHQVVEQIESFNMLKERMAPNSKYIIEDIYPENLYPEDFMSNFTIVDLTNIKNRADDKMFVYQKYI